MTANYISSMPTNGQKFIPGKNHPWRRYRVRFDKDNSLKEETPKNGRPLKEFLFDLVDCWDTFTVDSEFKGEVDYHKIALMSDKNIAAWLTDFIKKHWGQKAYENRVLG